MSRHEETELVDAARQLHDADGCGCDPRYLMSCPRMAAAILRAGQQQRQTDRPAEPASSARIDAVDLADRWATAAGIPIRPADVAAWLDRLGIPVPVGIHALVAEILRAVIAAGDAGYAHAVTVLRDDDRYSAWWSSTGCTPSGPARRHLADYLEAVGPAGFDPTTPAPVADGMAAARRRHALVFNAITSALTGQGEWLRLSVRERCAEAVLAALDADEPASDGTR